MLYMKQFKLNYYIISIFMQSLISQKLKKLQLKIYLGKIMSF